jgi:RHS repeat-associated protein
MLNEGMGGIMDYRARFYSPALSRFLQPDSIVPNAANPQAFNRYAYVLNDPIRFNDPSGNIPIDCWADPSYCSNTTTLPSSPYPSAGDRDDKDDPDTDGDGVPNIPDPDYPLITPFREEQSDCLPGNLVECFYNNGVMPGGNYEISLSEFLLLLKAINYDVARRGAVLDYSFRGWYDTPFFDVFELQSNVCIELIGCFTRQELNYVAQGAASAAAMEGKTTMTALITGWKVDQYSTDQHTSLPSVNTLRAAAIGHDYYVLTHPGNLLVSLTPFRNPIPFTKTVIEYCQSSNQYC